VNVSVLYARTVTPSEAKIWICAVYVPAKAVEGISHCEDIVP